MPSNTPTFVDQLNIKILEDNDFFNFKISVKSSDIFLTVKAYRKLSENVLRSLDPYLPKNLSVSWTDKKKL